MTLLHRTFLDDPTEYSQAEALWANEWAKLLDATQEQEDWITPWVSTSFVDGTPYHDGNPIFSAICSVRRLAIRVIQHEPGEDPGELHFWTDIFAEGQPEAVKELVISCVLSTETLDSSLKMMASWVEFEEVRLISTSGYRRYNDEPVVDELEHGLTPAPLYRRAYAHQIEVAA